MQERTQYLATDLELANRYQGVLHLGSGRQMVVTPQALTWNRPQSASSPAETRVYAINKVMTEGRRVIVHTVDTRPERRGHPIAYVFRMKKQWLLVSEQYSGREAMCFPRSPVHQYYAAL